PHYESRNRFEQAEPQLLQVLAEGHRRVFEQILVAEFGFLSGHGERRAKGTRVAGGDIPRPRLHVPDGWALAAAAGCRVSPAKRRRVADPIRLAEGRAARRARSLEMASCRRLAREGPTPILASPASSDKLAARRRIGQNPESAAVKDARILANSATPHCGRRC